MSNGNLSRKKLAWHEDYLPDSLEQLKILDGFVEMYLDEFEKVKDSFDRISTDKAEVTIAKIFVQVLESTCFCFGL